MMYPFMTLNDETEIVHSEMKKDGRVKVYIEKPDEKDGFHHETCWLPDYMWEDVVGFDAADILRYRGIIVSCADKIMSTAHSKSDVTTNNNQKARHHGVLFDIKNLFDEQCLMRQSLQATVAQSLTLPAAARR